MKAENQNQQIYLIKTLFILFQIIFKDGTFRFEYSLKKKIGLFMIHEGNAQYLPREIFKTKTNKAHQSVLQFKKNLSYVLRNGNH